MGAVGRGRSRRRRRHAVLRQGSPQKTRRPVGGNGVQQRGIGRRASSRCRGLAGKWPSGPDCHERFLPWRTSRTNGGDSAPMVTWRGGDRLGWEPPFGVGARMRAGCGGGRWCGVRARHVTGGPGRGGGARARGRAGNDRAGSGARAGCVARSGRQIGAARVMSGHGAISGASSRRSHPASGSGTAGAQGVGVGLVGAVGSARRCRPRSPGAGGDPASRPPRQCPRTWLPTADPGL